MITLIMATAALAAAVEFAAQSPPAAAPEPPPPPDRVRLTFDNRPVLSIGDAVRLELGGRLEGDVRADDASALDEGAVSWGDRRVEIEGRVTRRIEFDVSHEIGADRPWRDAYVEVSAHRSLSVRGGRFKVPFSYERLRGGGRLDFVNRSYAADRLAPGRQNGIVALGRIRRQVDYAAGVFGAGLPEDVALDPATRGIPRRPLYAARVTARPFRDRGDRRSPLRSLQFGASGLLGTSPPMLTTLGVRTLDAGERVFPAVYVNGARRGVGAEGQWSPGKWRVAGEWMRLRESRDRQALDGTDLPALAATGWYLSAVYQVATWRHDDAPSLASLLLGGLEVGGRVEGITFASGGARDPDVLLHPRIERVASHGLTAVTLGASWRLNRYGRVLGNVIAETPEVPETASLDRTRRWSGIVRLQLQF